MRPAFFHPRASPISGQISLNSHPVSQPFRQYPPAHHVRSLRPRAVRPIPTPLILSVPQRYTHSNNPTDKTTTASPNSPPKSPPSAASRSTSTTMHETNMSSTIAYPPPSPPAPFLHLPSFPLYPPLHPLANNVPQCDIVRSFLFNDKLDQRLRRPAGPNGAAGE